jgi:hypothetical protein
MMRQTPIGLSDLARLVRRDAQPPMPLIAIVAAASCGLEIIRSPHPESGLNATIVSSGPARATGRCTGGAEVVEVR